MNAQSPLTNRLQGFGASIFAEMTALAVSTGSINLGQGFPDYDGPAEVLQIAQDQISAGNNQYPPGIGMADLRSAPTPSSRHPGGGRGPALVQHGW